MLRIIAVVLVLLLLGCPLALAQDAAMTGQDHGDGLSLFGGVSRLVVRDEYVSREKYSGALPMVGLAWSRSYSSYAYSLQFQFLSPTQLTNFSVSARVFEIPFRASIVFQTTEGTIFDRKASIWIGPGIETLYHSRHQDIAGAVKVHSALGTIGATVNALGFCALGPFLQLEGATRVALLSFVMKSSRESESNKALLGPFSGLRAGGEVRMRCFVVRSLSLSLEYRLEATQVSAWEDFLSASDVGVLMVTYDL